MLMFICQLVHGIQWKFQGNIWRIPWRLKNAAGVAGGIFKELADV